MTDELKLALASLLALGLLMGGLFWWTNHRDAVKCHRAGAALHKESSYSVFYGCFLDGVPREMIRELE